MFRLPAPDQKREKRYNLAFMCFIAIFNIGLVIGLRILLDAVNEFDEKIVQGTTRYYLETFAFYFVTTFCFFCCGCFCCGGDCCVWISNAFKACNTYCYNMIISSNQRSSVEAYRQQQEAINNANIFRQQQISYNQRNEEVSMERPTSLRIQPGTNSIQIV